MVDKRAEAEAVEAARNGDRGSEHVPGDLAKALLDRWGWDMETPRHGASLRLVPRLDRSFDLSGIEVEPFESERLTIKLAPWGAMTVEVAGDQLTKSDLRAVSGLTNALMIAPKKQESSRSDLV